MRRCERRCEEEQMWEKMWRWADVREDLKMNGCEDEQMWEKMWRWSDVKMSRCEDEQMWEKIWRWADVKMRRCEDEQMWRWADVKMRRCEDEKVWQKVWRWEGVKMRRCEDEKVWRWEGVTEGVKRRCEDEIQTPTIGRTLRSDALGKKGSSNEKPPAKLVCADLFAIVHMFFFGCNAPCFSADRPLTISRGVAPLPGRELLQDDDVWSERNSFILGVKSGWGRGLVMAGERFRAWVKLGQGK